MAHRVINFGNGSNGTSSVSLVEKKQGFNNIKSISIVNRHNTDSITVDLFLSEGVNVFYLLWRVVIPNGTTLFLNEEESKFDNDEYAMIFVCTETDHKADIIIR